MYPQINLPPCSGYAAVVGVAAPVAVAVAIVVVVVVLLRLLLLLRLVSHCVASGMEHGFWRFRARIPYTLP